MNMRSGGTTGLVLGFFLLAVSLFPFGVGPETNILSRISAGVIWVAALLSALLSLERIFQADYEDGTLDQVLTGAYPAEALVGVKILAHWIIAGLPLVIAAPVLGILLNLPAGAQGYLVFSLGIGTPALSALGSIAAALSVSVKRGGVLIAILVMPLYIPTLIFGVGIVDSALHAGFPAPSMLVLGAVTLVALAIAPFAAAAALRLAVE